MVLSIICLALRPCQTLQEFDFIILWDFLNERVAEGDASDPHDFIIKPSSPYIIWANEKNIKQKWNPFVVWVDWNQFVSSFRSTTTTARLR